MQDEAKRILDEIAATSRQLAEAWDQPERASALKAKMDELREQLAALNASGGANET